MLSIAWLTVALQRHTLDCPCDITTFGAVPGNRTSDAKRNAAAMRSALVSCDCVRVPAGAFKISPVTLPSHRVLFLDHGASLVGSDRWEDYGSTWFMPRMGQSLQLRPLLSATNATNVTITGLNGTLDGNGWFAWPVTNWSSPECGLHGRCAPDVFFGNSTVGKLRPPHLLTFIHSSDIAVINITITNPAFWGLQHFYCNRSVHKHVTILAPRWTREIAGFMPWSVLDYLVEDSYVHVGDDAVAIMSGADAPTRRVVFRRLFARGRSVAIGSADYGNVSGVYFDRCTIGDDKGSAPWAFKIKMHLNRAAVVEDIQIRDTKLGKIAANAWQDPKPYPAVQMEMNYGRSKLDPTLGQPRIRNISFVNVSAAQTHVVAQLDGATEGSISGLRFVGCQFRSNAKTPWLLENVDTASCSSVGSTPVFPTGA